MSKLPHIVPENIVLFGIDENRYALFLSVVERIIRAVEIIPLPKAPEIVLGVINLQGEIIPVIDIRKRFRLPEREMNLEDRFIIARTSKRLVALMADTVIGNIEIKESRSFDSVQKLPYAEYIKGIAKIENNIVLIHDLDKFLSIEEEGMIDSALAKKR